MQGLTIQQLADLYIASTPEVRKWIQENVREWKEKPPPIKVRVYDALTPVVQNWMHENVHLWKEEPK